MSSILDNPGVRESALRLDVEQYHRLCETGVIPEKTELIAGIVVVKMGKSPLHSWTVQFLAEWLRAAVTAECHVRVEQPLALHDSEPEPDLAIVTGTRDDYRNAHPSTAELVIEVSVSSEDIDREKAAVYAAAGIREYWIVLPGQQKVLILRNPVGNTYAEQQSAGTDGQLQMGACRLSCGELFPA